MRSITDGVVDRDGVAGLAHRLGYSARQLQRLLVSEVGAGPLELARAQRAETARILLETTDLQIGRRRLRRRLRQCPPVQRHRAGRLRRNPHGHAGPGPAGRPGRRPIGSRRPAADTAAGDTAASSTSITLRLAYRRPFPSSALFSFLAARAVPGVEEGDASYYRRSLVLPHGSGLATLSDGGDGALHCVLQLEDLRDLTTAAKRLRYLFDLDADPAAVAEILGADPLLGPALAAAPGLRIPGHVDGDELLVRAVLGQQVTVVGARTIAGRLAAAHGSPLPSPLGTVTRTFPTAAAIAKLSPSDLPDARGPGPGPPPYHRAPGRRRHRPRPRRRPG